MRDLRAHMCQPSTSTSPVWWSWSCSRSSSRLLPFLTLSCVFIQPVKRRLASLALGANASVGYAMILTLSLKSSLGKKSSSLIRFFQTPGTRPAEGLGGANGACASVEAAVSSQGNISPVEELQKKSWEKKQKTT